MSQNLLVAEGLDALRQCEAEKQELDQMRLKIKGGSSGGDGLVLIVQKYQKLLQKCVQGMEILNHVRHTVLNDADAQSEGYGRKLADFCSQKILECMKNCKNITDMLDSISYPLSHVEFLNREGYTVESTVYFHDGKRFPLKGKSKMIAEEFNLTDGTYVMVIKNLDDYTLAQPDVSVALTLTPQCDADTEVSRAQFTLPGNRAWRKSIGVVGNTKLKLQVHSSGMRESHIDVQLQKWKPVGGAPTPGGGGCSAASPKSFANPGEKIQNQYSGGDSFEAQQSGARWKNQLPPLPDSELEALASFNVPKTELPHRDSTAGDHSPTAAASQSNSHLRNENPWSALENISVPHGSDRDKYEFFQTPDPVEYRPKNMTCQERMQKLRAMLNAWPVDGVNMSNIPANSQRILSSVYALPLPTEIE